MKIPVKLSMVTPDEIVIGSKVIGQTGIIYEVCQIKTEYRKPKEIHYYVFEIKTDSDYLSIMTVNNSDMLLVVEN